MDTVVKVVVRDAFRSGETLFEDQAFAELPTPSLDELYNAAHAFPRQLGVETWYGVRLQKSTSVEGGRDGGTTVQVMVEFYEPLRDLAYATLLGLLLKFLADELKSDRDR